MPRPITYMRPTYANADATFRTARSSEARRSAIWAETPRSPAATSCPRPAAEVNFLMRLLESSVDAELPGLMENNVRLRILGERDVLAPGVRASVERATAATAGNTGLTLQIALNYGGRREIVRAIRALAGRVARGEILPSAIEEADVASALDTAGGPDPDLLIRTSGEYRLSNFLLWQVAYTELLVVPTLWPDFSARDLYLAVADFQRRSRRFGGL